MADFTIPAGVLPAHRDLYYGGGCTRRDRQLHQPAWRPRPAEPIAEAPVAEAADVDAAVQAAHAAFAPWSCAHYAGRARPASCARRPTVLRRHADDLRGRSNLLPR